MKDTTKTIIIGILITILVLALTLFILYKTSSKKINNENSSNKNESTNSTPVTNNSNDNNSLPNTSIKDDEKNNKVILYLFHGGTCSACNNAISSIKETRNTTFKNVEIRAYEVWNNKDNSTLMKKVAEKLNVEARYIPYFVIGKYNKDGFNSETLIKEYKNALNNKDYQDIVSEVIKENPDLNPIYTTL